MSNLQDNQQQPPPKKSIGLYLFGGLLVVVVLLMVFGIIPNPFASSPRTIIVTTPDTTTGPASTVVDTKVGAAATPGDNPNVNTGSTYTPPEVFVIKNPSTGFCLDDTGTGLGGAEYWNWDCDINNPHQQFVFENNLIRSATKVNQCLDDKATTARGQNALYVHGCNKNNGNQLFTYNPNTKLLKSLNKNNLCIDNAKSGTPAPKKGKFHLWDCLPNIPAQQFELVSANLTCLPSGGKLYPGCGFVYRTEQARNTQCGNNGQMLQRVGSNCNYTPGTLLYPGCGYIYETKEAYDTQCKPWNDNKNSVPLKWVNQ
jgi:hypothetical protein